MLQLRELRARRQAHVAVGERVGPQHPTEDRDEQHRALDPPTAGEDGAGARHPGQDEHRRRGGQGLGHPRQPKCATTSSPIVTPMTHSGSSHLRARSASTKPSTIASVEHAEQRVGDPGGLGSTRKSPAGQMPSACAALDGLSRLPSSSPLVSVCFAPGETNVVAAEMAGAGEQQRERHEREHLAPGHVAALGTGNAAMSAPSRSGPIQIAAPALSAEAVAAEATAIGTS